MEENEVNTKQSHEVEKTSDEIQKAFKNYYISRQERVFKLRKGLDHPTKEDDSIHWTREQFESFVKRLISLNKTELKEKHQFIELKDPSDTDNFLLVNDSSSKVPMFEKANPKDKNFESKIQINFPNLVSFVVSNLQLVDIILNKGIYDLGQKNINFIKIFLLTLGKLYFLQDEVDLITNNQNESRFLLEKSNKVNLLKLLDEFLMVTDTHIKTQMHFMFHKLILFILDRPFIKSEFEGQIKADKVSLQISCQRLILFSGNFDKFLLYLFFLFLGDPFFEKSALIKDSGSFIQFCRNRKYNKTGASLSHKEFMSSHEKLVFYNTFQKFVSRNKDVEGFDAIKDKLVSDFKKLALVRSERCIPHDFSKNGIYNFRSRQDFDSLHFYSTGKTLLEDILCKNPSEQDIFEMSGDSPICEIEIFLNVFRNWIERRSHFLNFKTKFLRTQQDRDILRDFFAELDGFCGDKSLLNNEDVKNISSERFNRIYIEIKNSGILEMKTD